MENTQKAYSEFDGDIDSFKIIHYEENKIVWIKDGKNGRSRK